ncbi:hypothetical protein SAMN05428949_6491 [Chitinophaga sp. YR627]|nr:hypothetical protein SAMN05428949_6491 [Chitinophaga sp. YR627]
MVRFYSNSGHKSGKIGVSDLSLFNIVIINSVVDAKAIAEVDERFSDCRTTSIITYHSYFAIRYSIIFFYTSW